MMNKENWNKFIIENNGSFLQSWEWGEFQRAFGKTELSFDRRVFRLAGGGWQAQFVEMTVPIINKRYWYCPRGPIINFQFSPALPRLGRGRAIYNLQKIIEEIKSEAKKDGIIFFRIGPEWKQNCHSDPAVAGEESSRLGKVTDIIDSSACGLKMTELLKENGFKQLHYDIEPSQTLILDLDKSEEELLARMHEKWRYNIRLAERKGVKIKFVMSNITNFEQYFEEFYKLVDGGTSERKQIRHHPKDYYRKQLEINSEDIKFELFVAEFEGKVVAANIVVFFGKTATYLHGATDNNFRNLMAPHLLQWEQIKYAKQLGCAQYDFWGIVNEHTLDKRGFSWEGFTRFKKGFGGREENYIGYWDYPLNKFWYFIYRLAQKARR